MCPWYPALEGHSGTSADNNDCLFKWQVEWLGWGHRHLVLTIYCAKPHTQSWAVGKVQKSSPTPHTLSQTQVPLALCSALIDSGTPWPLWICFLTCARRILVVPQGPRSHNLQSEVLLTCSNRGSIVVIITAFIVCWPSKVPVLEGKMLLKGDNAYVYKLLNMPLPWSSWQAMHPAIVTLRHRRKVIHGPACLQL
jgi:hypothetical protein